MLINILYLNINLSFSQAGTLDKKGKQLLFPLSRLTYAHLLCRLGQRKYNAGDNQKRQKIGRQMDTVRQQSVG